MSHQCVSRRQSVQRSVYVKVFEVFVKARFRRLEILSLFLLKKITLYLFRTHTGYLIPLGESAKIS